MTMSENYKKGKLQKPLQIKSNLAAQGRAGFRDRSYGVEAAATGRIKGRRSMIGMTY